jgi:hypothetical protein
VPLSLMHGGRPLKAGWTSLIPANRLPVLSASDFHSRDACPALEVEVSIYSCTFGWEDEPGFSKTVCFMFFKSAKGRKGPGSQ